jgi:NAD(P)-dependent dehydrogenase (short-subunit alcohol dehydrogenase family)
MPSRQRNDDSNDRSSPQVKHDEKEEFVNPVYDEMRSMMMNALADTASIPEDMATKRRTRAGDVQGRVALVTGGAEGIGRGIAEVLVEHGAAVGLVDRNADAGQATATALTDMGGRAAFAAGDVADERHVAAAVERVVGELGAPTILVNNAAIFMFSGIEQTTIEQWRQILDVNVIGSALVVKHVVPHMRAAGGGTIVNIGSGSGFIGQEGFLPYSTTKAAILGMTRCLAVDLARDGIRVNAVCPGPSWSAAVQGVAREAGWSREEASRQAMFGGGAIQGRIADTREIGEVVAFVASGRASFMTGASVMVDGGLTAV